MTPRYALYFTPAPGSSLARLGASVLGYDVHTGETVSRPPLPGVDLGDFEKATAQPSRYGFHATLKAPMRLAEDVSADDLAAAARRFASLQPPVPVGALQIALLGGFVALVPSAAPAALAILAAECVAYFDRFRRPLEDGDRERRAGLSPRQAALLERWGYPYVFDEFRFHMTLTGELAPGERAIWLERLAPLVEAGGHDVIVDGLSLLRQDDSGAAFRVVERFAFQG